MNGQSLWRRANGPLVLGVLMIGFSSAAWAQSPAGGEFPVNTYTSDYQEGAAIAFGSGGDFVAAWTSRPYCPFVPPPNPPPPCNPAQDGSFAGVFARRFDAAGAPIGNDFQVNVATIGSQFNPAIARLSSGRFVVAWTYDLNPPGPSIAGRMLDSSGVPSGGEFVISPPGSIDTTVPPAVAAGPGGEFIALWGLNGRHIRGRQFDGQGVPLGPEFPASIQPMSISTRVQSATDPAGNFMVVWTASDGASLGVVARKFDRSGTPVGAEFVVNSYTTGFQQEADVAADAAGNFLVAWRAWDQRAIFARRYDAANAPMGPEFQVSSYTTFIHAPSVASEATGGFVVTWPAWSSGVPVSIRARRFDRNGVPGPELRADSATTFSKGTPDVAVDDAGNAVVTWASEDQDGSRSGVYGQRFGGLRPVGIEVDSAVSPTSNGNRVFEPGETVEVEPAWRNVSAAVMLPFTGAATSFAGPTGAFYTIFDDSAVYPVVPDGATARCRDEANCFQMGVADPSGRPSVHWDATFVEALGGNAPPLAKVWPVHLGGSFADIPSSSGFYRFVETILHKGVTGGCSPLDYCPSASTTRDQMAVFALVSREGAGYAPAACGATPMFADVPPTSPFCRWIEDLARRGVVGGCGGGNYCPSLPVTREQMAVFALKTLEGSAYVPPACGTPMYSDVPAASPFCPYVEEITRRAVVTGCGGGAYCPAAAVTREQMSVFLTVTFGLTLYGL